MKAYIKFFAVAVVFFCLASCNSNYTVVYKYYQVAQTRLTSKSMARYESAINAYVYEDENVRIVYDFWCLGGVSQCNVYNKTDEIIYLDVDKSFLVINNVSMVYFQPTFTESDHTITAVKACRPVAPKAHYSLPGQLFGYTQYVDCDFSIAPKENAPEMITFNTDNSPFIYNSIISYRVGDNPTLHMTNCEFFISSITNYRASDLEHSSSERGNPCLNNFYKGQNEVTSVTTWLYSPATAFYVEYRH